MMLRRKDFPCWFGRITVIGVDLMLKSRSRSIGCVSVYLIFFFVHGIFQKKKRI